MLRHASRRAAEAVWSGEVPNGVQKQGALVQRRGTIVDHALLQALLGSGALQTLQLLQWLARCTSNGGCLHQGRPAPLQQPVRPDPWTAEPSGGCPLAVMTPHNPTVSSQQLTGQQADLLPAPAAASKQSSVCISGNPHPRVPLHHCNQHLWRPHGTTAVDSCSRPASGASGVSDMPDSRLASGCSSWHLSF